MKLKNARILHLGNIANNAYLNAKFLRAHNLKAEVISHDYYDLVATPEWEEGKNNCPSWFMSGSLAEVADKFGYKDSFSNLLIKKSTKNKIVNFLIQKTNEKYLKLNRYLNPYYEYLTLNEYWYYKKLCQKFKKYFPQRKDILTIKDILPYSKDIRVFKKIFSNYDLIQCYGLEPVYALLSGNRPYIAYEHGTLRNFPFEDSPRGRLAALSYKMANLVFITNPDNIRAAKKLKLNNFKPIPHPINDCWYKKSKTIQKKEQVIFCPSRHDWQEKMSDHLIRALGKINPKLKQNLKIIFVKWGNDLKKSQDLINKTGLKPLIEWKELLNRQELSKEIASSDIILDQIKYHGLGGITAESLLAGKPVLNSYDKKLCEWIFPDSPPIVSVFNEEEITEELNKLLSQPELANKIGKQSKVWFKKYHSPETVTNILISNYRRLLR